MVKGITELESLEIKLKRKVKGSKRGFSQETCTTNDKNLDANSMGSASQEMQMTRNELIEAFIQAKVDAEKAEMTHHPSPGNPIKGERFTGRLYNNKEGKLLCRMLKVAFRKGLMFILGKDGKVILDGVSLYNGLVLGLGRYRDYPHKLKAELAAKGITEAETNPTEKLEETFTF